MTRFGKIIVLIISTLQINLLFAQNIFDKKHSEDFANYLYNSGDYKLANEEYFRLAFLSPDDSLYKLRWLETYRLSGMPQKEYEAFYKIFPSKNEIKGAFAKEYLKLDVSLELGNDIISFAKDNPALSPQEKKLFLLTGYLVSGKWDSAGTINITPQDLPVTQNLQSIVKETRRIKFKKPWLAATLSTVIPGTGKMYSGRVWDGVISFVFVAGNAFLAYRGFSQRGIGSGIGWFFAASGTFFYLGNIYGSYKAAIHFNNQKRHEIHHKVKNIIVNKF